MKPIIVYLTEEEHEKLRQRAFEQKISMSGMLKAGFNFEKTIVTVVERKLKEDIDGILSSPLVSNFNPVPKLGKKK